MTDSDQPTNGETEIRQTGVYEMLWDCEHCGAQKLLGHTHQFCPNCGAEQNPERRYFPAEEDKVAVEQHFYFGNDRPCPSCDAMNGAQASFCHLCGTALTAEAAAAPSGAPDASPQNADGGKKSGWIGKAAIGVLAAGGAGYYLMSPTIQGVEVTGLEWQRSVQIERFGPQSRNAWCEALPAGATDVTRKSEERERRKIPEKHRCEAWCDQLPASLMVDPEEIRQVSEVRSRQQIKTGEKCETQRVALDDGTFREEEHCTPQYRKEPVMANKCYLDLPGDAAKPAGLQCKTDYREEPVFAQKCYYTIDDWGPDRVVKAEGSDRQPVWPETALANTGQCLGCEREGTKTERYSVVFRAAEDGQQYRCDLPFSSWERIDPGTHWEIAVTGNEADCTEMKRVR